MEFTKEEAILVLFQQGSIQNCLVLRLQEGAYSTNIYVYIYTVGIFLKKPSNEKGSYYNQYHF